MTRAVLVYDGSCRLCEAASRRIARLAPAGAVERRDFRAPGVLDGLPGVTLAACEQALQLVEPGGRVRSGAEAVACVLSLRPLLRPVAALYFVPGLRQLADAAYRWIAQRRYRLFGRAHACDGSCAAR